MKEPRREPADIAEVGERQHHERADDEREHDAVELDQVELEPLRLPQEQHGNRRHQHRPHGKQVDERADDGLLYGDASHEARAKRDRPHA